MKEKLELLLKLINTFTIMGILIILILILKNLPPQPITRADILKFKNNPKKIQKLLNQVPYSYLTNNELDVNVTNYELDVNVTNHELDVNIANEPIRVTTW